MREQAVEALQRAAGLTIVGVAGNDFELVLSLSDSSSVRLTGDIDGEIVAEWLEPVAR